MAIRLGIVCCRTSARLWFTACEASTYWAVGAGMNCCCCFLGRLLNVRARFSSACASSSLKPLLQQGRVLQEQPSPLELCRRCLRTIGPPCCKEPMPNFILRSSTAEIGVICPKLTRRPLRAPPLRLFG